MCPGYVPKLTRTNVSHYSALHPTLLDTFLRITRSIPTALRCCMALMIIPERRARGCYGDSVSTILGRAQTGAAKGTFAAHWCYNSGEEGRAEMLPSWSAPCPAVLPSSFCLAGVTLPSSGSSCGADTELGSLLLAILQCPCSRPWCSKRSNSNSLRSVPVS